MVPFTPHEARGQENDSNHNNWHLLSTYYVPGPGLALYEFSFNPHRNCIISIHFEDEQRPRGARTQVHLTVWYSAQVCLAPKSIFSTAKLSCLQD